jgi:predicted kinase
MNHKIEDVNNYSENGQVTLYITIGIPGSGKSTWVRNNLRVSGKIIVALDEIRKKRYGFFPQNLNDDLESEVWKEAISQAVSAIEAGNDAVIDSMALTIEFRRKIFKMIAEGTDAKFNKIAIFIDTPVEVAIQRNYSRQKIVKEETILDMSRHLQEPTEAEGFQKVIRIKA